MELKFDPPRYMESVLGRAPLSTVVATHRREVLSDGRPYIKCCPWITACSGLAIRLAVLAVNLGGDAPQDLLDPRLRGE